MRGDFPLRLLTLGVVSCGPHSSDYRISPSDWSSSASREPPCSTSAYTGESRSFELPGSLGQIALPVTLTREPVDRSSSEVYVGADSSRVELWVSPEPAAGLMTSSTAKLRLESPCRITVGGRFALVTPFQLADSGMKTFREAAIVNALPLPGIALNVMISSPTLAGRSALLDAVAHVRIPALLLSR